MVYSNTNEKFTIKKGKDTVPSLPVPSYPLGGEKDKERINVKEWCQMGEKYGKRGECTFGPRRR